MLKELKKSATIQLIFFVSIVLSLITIYVINNYLYQQKRLTVQSLTNSYVSVIKNNVSQTLSATFPLAAMVRKQQGDVTGFTQLATELSLFRFGIQKFVYCFIHCVRHR